MNLLELVSELNLVSRRSSVTKGGEYHSACPGCGGKDRFILWPEQGRYWCRQCDKKGDTIQFCRDFLGMDYRSACAKAGIEPKKMEVSSYSLPFRQEFSPEPAGIPSEIWQKKAKEFALLCHDSLLKNDEAIQLLSKRGLSLSTIREFCLGWNPMMYSIPLNEWDLPVSLKEDGKERRLWLPKGIVIPVILNGAVIKLKIRRNDWHMEDHLPKYVEVSGSMKCPAVYGHMELNTILVVEAELDAILIQQHASDLCCCMAIGGAGKKPDLDSDRLLRRVDRILFSLDFDEAGKKAYKFWRSTYAKLKPWPAPKGKSPGDACVDGVDLRHWVESGIRSYDIL